MVGSINLDKFSLEALEEGSLVMSDPKVAQQLEQAWEKDITHSKEVLDK